jgi:hypothetical protein
MRGQFNMLLSIFLTKFYGFYLEIYGITKGWRDFQQVKPEGSRIDFAD